MADNEVAIDETPRLISNKIERAAYERDGGKLGSVNNFLVGKRPAQVGYAVLPFGSVFGIGGDDHPMPWDMGSCAREQGGYGADIAKFVLGQAQRYECDTEPACDHDYGQATHRYCGPTS
ncbi:PRC-barrel domain containing protein [Sphingomonas sp. JC676]|uniref:PRC-barrel domain containing protein n=1 Tax=Sphingomonas sp. JC676 TaxID=2768065 RepID=UPI0016578EA3|nr:PRC-barrel domain containing protein [Sphingomonas sp. JC676]MBC9033858.1 PRC-barrel domain containing protein [Sphingomonas sp. JC676]